MFLGLQVHRCGVVGELGHGGSAMPEMFPTREEPATAEIARGLEGRQRIAPRPEHAADGWTKVGEEREDFPRDPTLMAASTLQYCEQAAEIALQPANEYARTIA